MNATSHAATAVEFLGETAHTSHDKHALIYIQSAGAGRSLACGTVRHTSHVLQQSCACAATERISNCNAEDLSGATTQFGLHRFHGLPCFYQCASTLPPSSIIRSISSLFRTRQLIMQHPNFTRCGQIYTSDDSLIARYNYSGWVVNIPANPRTQITYTGCRAVCGSGSEYYPWIETSATITTWVLPILGTLLQAPFESNTFWRTVKAINRWIGSPISSLASILCDIEVSGKCAIFGEQYRYDHGVADIAAVDMSVPYNETPGANSEYAGMRDSFYILMNLNQYKMKPIISMTREAEGLLRIVLFSQDLKLVGKSKTLSQMRHRLAKDLRSNRRRGVVPVFISTLWFILSLAISIEAGRCLVHELPH
jgi:hypothetical protein